MSRTRRAAALLCTLVGLTCCLAGCGDEEAPLRFDGLYRSDAKTSPNSTYFRYLRFYEDGTVISVSSTGRPNEVATWFREPYENRGPWVREEGLLRFSCTGSRGTVDYEAEVGQDALEVRYHSHINDKRGEGSYEFVALEEVAEGP